jgi:hypothetical protein
METKKTKALSRRIEIKIDAFNNSIASLEEANRRLSYSWESDRTTWYELNLHSLTFKLRTLCEELEQLNGLLKDEIEQWIETDQKGKNHLQAIGFLGGYTQLDSPTGYTEYILLHGYQFQYYEKHIWGELTEDDWKELGEDPFKNDYFKGSLTFFSAEQSAAYTAVDGRLATSYGFFEGSLGSVQAGAIESFVFEEGALNAKVSGSAGAYLAQGSYNGLLLGVSVAASAYLGANVSGDAALTYDPKQGELGVRAGGKAFFGAKAEASVTKEVEIFDGVKALGTVHGSVSSGVGISANAEAGFSKGHFKMDYELGLTIGLGAEIGGSVDLDVQGAAEKIVDSGMDIVNRLFEM